MKHGQLSVSALLNVWRILVVTLAFELLGGAIALALGMHHSRFSNFWLGGVAGMLPGFAVGVAWQIASGKGRRGWVGTASWLGFIGIAITGFAFGFDLPQMRGEMRRLEAAANLQTEAIQRIDVYDGSREQLIVSITEPASLAAFAQGIADVVGHSPNHPRYSRSWSVVVHGKTRYEFNLHTNSKFPQSVIGYFVSMSGNWEWSHGSFKSDGLRPWVEEHLMNID
jgi:hypothetical protein